MKLFLFALTAALISLEASAKILQVVPGNQQINGVKVNKSASFMTSENETVNMSSVGAALVTKTIFNVPIYVGQFYVSDSSLYKLPNKYPLDSIHNANMKAVVMQMTFLHSAEAKQLQDVFKKGFEINNVKHPEAASALEKVLAAGGVNQDNGTVTLTVVAERLKDGSELVRYENSETGITQSIKTQTPGFIRDIFSVWLGELSDGGAKKLKKVLTEGI